MAVSHKGAISFGLVYIPVGLYTATTDNDLHFNQLCRADGSRVRYKKVCSKCGEEVKNDDIVKGFEYEKDRYVVVSDEDFEKAKTPKDKTIHILHFTDLDSIRPIFYDKTYHVLPDKGGEKAYELLREAMLSENKVAIAKTVLGNSEKLLSIIPTEDGLLIETMFFFDEIKAIPKSIPQVNLNEEELNMAKTLINSLNKEFQPELYHDEYQIRLREIIEDKIAGKEIVQSQETDVYEITDLMDALKKSIEQQQRKSS